MSSPSQIGTTCSVAHAYRMRAWFWLWQVSRLAGLEHPAELSKLPECHHLMAGLDRDAFKQVLRLASAPARVLGGGTCSLLEHVRNTPGYEAATDAYHHPIWKYLAGKVDGEIYFRSQLEARGIIEVLPGDWVNSGWLGVDQDDFYVDGDTLELVLNWQDFISLDGLLIISKLSQVAHRSMLKVQAAHLDHALFSAAESLGRQHGLKGAAFDQWQWITRSSLVGARWPEEPTAHELEQAHAQLQRENSTTNTGRGTTNTGRRTRQQQHVAIDARARANRFSNPSGWFGFRWESPWWKWMITHRHLIDTHVDTAINRSMGIEVVGPDPAPLTMAHSLFKMRIRPRLSDREREIFGHKGVYDQIPIQVLDETLFPQIAQ